MLYVERNDAVIKSRTLVLARGPVLKHQPGQRLTCGIEQVHRN